jgi:hypothetical protein
VAVVSATIFDAVLLSLKTPLITEDSDDMKIAGIIKRYK